MPHPVLFLPENLVDLILFTCTFTFYFYSKCFLSFYLHSVSYSIRSPLACVVLTSLFYFLIHFSLHHPRSSSHGNDLLFSLCYSSHPVATKVVNILVTKLPSDGLQKEPSSDVMVNICGILNNLVIASSLAARDITFFDGLPKLVGIKTSHDNR